MHTKYVFRVSGRWEGGVNGKGELVNEEQTMRLPFGVAEEFGEPVGRQTLKSSFSPRRARAI